MTEGAFMTEILNVARKVYPDCLAEPHWTSPAIPLLKDGVQVTRPGKNGKIVPVMRFQPKNPYDAYILWRGKFAAIEAKQCKGMSLPMGGIKHHQVTKLLKARGAGGSGWFLVNLRDIKLEKLEGGEAEWHTYAHIGMVNAGLLITPERMGEAIRESVNMDRKSIPAQTLVNVSTAKFGRNCGKWDVEKMFAEIFGQ